MPQQRIGSTARTLSSTDTDRNPRQTGCPQLVASYDTQDTLGLFYIPGPTGGKLLYGNHGGRLIKIPLTLTEALTTVYSHIIMEKTLCFSNFLQIEAQASGCTESVQFVCQFPELQHSADPGDLVANFGYQHVGAFILEGGCGEAHTSTLSFWVVVMAASLIHVFHLGHSSEFSYRTMGVVEVINPSDSCCSYFTLF